MYVCMYIYTPSFIDIVNSIVDINYIYIYIYVCVCVCEREREREREREEKEMCYVMQ